MKEIENVNANSAQGERRTSFISLSSPPPRLLLQFDFAE